jgi:hypothetical protein
MKTFLLLYTNGTTPPPSTEAEQAAAMQAWTQWFTEIGDAMVDSGNPFTPAVKTVSQEGKVDDAPPPLSLGGYSLIKAYSHAVAAEIAKDCPILQGGGQVLIYETFDIM